MYYLLFDDDDVLFLSVSTRFIDEKALKCAGDLKANAYCVTEWYLPEIPEDTDFMLQILVKNGQLFIEIKVKD